MSILAARVRTGRLVWTVLVSFYFLVFFRNLLADALPSGSALPLAFAVGFVLWMAVEYYFGSPFFQSGVVEHSAFWRGLFAFFAYPFFGYVAADFIWWHWTQVPVPAAVTGLLGLALFALGTYGRLASLFDLLRIVQVRPVAGRKGPAAEQAVVPEKKFVGLRLQRLVRHPRYLGTFVQLVGAALVFRSWGGLLLAFLVGLPLVWQQVRYEDARLPSLLKSESRNYAERVPRFWPRLRTPA